jgi:hypothetical protein
VSPRVVVSRPAFGGSATIDGWPSANVPPPKITGSAGAELTQFAAFRNAASTLTFGCVATPIPGWVEDMRPPVEGRTVALAGASAALAAGHPIDARPNGRGGFDLRDVRELGADPPPIGNAKTFLGFDAHRVHTCFATCIGADCASAVDAAHLEGSAEPPHPGLALASATWAVHHTRPFATAAAVTLVLLGAALVVTRRKPRYAAR